MTIEIMVIHGPNLNMLGQREPEIYGNKTLYQINSELKEHAKKAGVKVETFQSNYEGALVEAIHKATSLYQGLIINPAAYTHTSIAIRDALLLLNMPVIEIHLSNIKKRETFRHNSLITDIVLGQISGFGYYGYIMALDALMRLVQKDI